MFKISFRYLDRTYSAKVQKILHQPVQFVVFDFVPYISYLPVKLVFQSHAQKDQLIYQSFDVMNKEILTTIGQTIFVTCFQQKINIHS